MHKERGLMRTVGSSLDREGTEVRKELKVQVKVRSQITGALIGSREI